MMLRTHNHMLSRTTRLAAVCLMAMVVGCASVPDRNPVPPGLTTKVGIPGIPEARFWGDENPEWSRNRMDTFTDGELRNFLPGIYNKPHNYIAISGGGAKGAFGAGLLVGWSATGTRPEFSMVTGISTGALTAPFAFLGPDYDYILKKIYTTTSTKDIVRKRNIITALFRDSMTDTEPLKATIAKYIDSYLVEAVAREFKRGRQLYVGTVNLNVGRSVIWNIGAIAASNHPQKLELIRDILRASAAIPVVFPPVMITVESDGEHYDEMHVDGGTGSQVFVYPAAIDWKELTRKLKVQGKPKVFVVRNAFIDPDYQDIERQILPIASRTIDSLIRTQGIGDLYQIYALSQRDGNDFNLAYIPSEFTEEPTEDFDPVYMGKLFDLGYQMALDGYPWQKTPPGFTSTP